jgi:DNA polymerase
MTALQTINEIFEDYRDNPAFAVDVSDRLVLGRGPVPCSVAMVGDAPRQMDDRVGLPFCGPAGQMLSAALQQAGLDRDELWLTNVVKLRPFDPEDKGERHPLQEEIVASIPYLRRELRAVGARYALAMGKVAAETLTGRRHNVSRSRGMWWTESGIDIMVTHHPAVAMYRGPMKTEFFADVVKFAEEIHD